MNEFFGKMVCRCFQTKENAIKKLVFRFQHFLVSFAKKNPSQNRPKIKKIFQIQTC